MRIAVTMGDPAGIGPEIILKAARKLVQKSIPVIVGNQSILDQARSVVRIDSDIHFRPFGSGKLGQIEIIDPGAIGRVQFGKSDDSCGYASFMYIKEALLRVLGGEVSAMVTCPITKKSIRSAGIKFIGHTEMMAHYSGSADYVMMMGNRRIKVSLVTIHVPLTDVSHLVTENRVFSCIAITARSLKYDFGIRSPFIKVCGLNPHAGESGLMGKEEAVISAAITRAKAIGINVEGPFPADSLFYHIDCDAYVAMYHDQGLLPIKTLDFKRTVNITLGLPIIRTSVGHGTGLNIAGKDMADPTSLIEAYFAAQTMAVARNLKDQKGRDRI